jgi:hypothetical protein
MLGGSSCCGSSTGGAKNANKVVKPKKLVKKYGNRKGGNSETGSETVPVPVPVPETVPGNVTGGAKKKKGSKVGVKRALTPYNKFVKKHFAEIKKKFPDEKAPQIMQKVAVEWKIFKNK